MLQLPAHLQGRAPALSNLTGGLGSAQPPTISRKGMRFTLMSANGDVHGTIAPSLTCDIVIVGGNPHASKVYYENDWDPNDTTAPDCFSDNGESPSANAAKPQSEFCANCPQNVWGSKISRMSGKKIQACATHKKISCIVIGDNTGTVYLLSIPPASLSNWRGYIKMLEGQGVSAEQVITRVSFSNDEQGVLEFAAASFITEAMVAPVYAIIESDAPKIVCGALDKPRQAALPAPTSIPGTPPVDPRGQIHSHPEDRQPEAPPRAAPRPDPIAALAATQVPAGAAEAPKPRGRSRPKAQEPNGLAAAPVTPPEVDDEEAELLRQLEAARAKKAGQQTPPQPPPAAPAQSFGIGQPAPASQSVEDMLSAAFNIKV